MNESNLKDEARKALLDIALILFCSSAFLFGIYVGERKTQRNAVRNNAAEYGADEKGNVIFKWKGTK